MCVVLVSVRYVYILHISVCGLVCVHEVYVCGLCGCMCTCVGCTSTSAHLHVEARS